MEASEDNAPEEPHCTKCGASLWFEEESRIKGVCIMCYWDHCDEDREWYAQLDKDVYYMKLLCELTGRKWVTFLLEQSRGAD